MLKRLQLWWLQFSPGCSVRNPLLQSYQWRGGSCGRLLVNISSLGSSVTRDPAATAPTAAPPLARGEGGGGPVFNHTRGSPGVISLLHFSLWFKPRLNTRGLVISAHSLCCAQDTTHGMEPPVEDCLCPGQLGPSTHGSKHCEVLCVWPKARGLMEKLRWTRTTVAVGESGNLSYFTPDSHEEKGQC